VLNSLVDYQQHQSTEGLQCKINTENLVRFGHLLRPGKGKGAILIAPKTHTGLNLLEPLGSLDSDATVEENTISHQNCIVTLQRE